MSLIEDLVASIEDDKQTVEGLGAGASGLVRRAEELIGTLSGLGVRMEGHPLSFAKQTLEECVGQCAALGHQADQARSAAEAAKGADGSA